MTIRVGKLPGAPVLNKLRSRPSFEHEAPRLSRLLTAGGRCSPRFKEPGRSEQPGRRPFVAVTDGWPFRLAPHLRPFITVIDGRLVISKRR